MLLFNCKLYEFEKKTSAHFLKRLSFLNYKEFNTDVFERKIWESEIWYNISSIKSPPSSPASLSPYWFELNNLETVEAITQEFCSIQQHFIGNICTKFGIFKSLQCPDAGQNSDGCIFNFWISGQSLIKENWHSSRIKDDIYIKFGPVTKLDKRNKKP